MYIGGWDFVREVTCKKSYAFFFFFVPTAVFLVCRGFFNYLQLQFQPEYLEAKAKWEATLGKMEELTTHTTELVRAREVVYDQLVGASLSAYAASEEAAASSAR